MLLSVTRHPPPSTLRFLLPAPSRSGQGWSQETWVRDKLGRLCSAGSEPGSDVVPFLQLPTVARATVARGCCHLRPFSRAARASSVAARFV